MITKNRYFVMRHGQSVANKRNIITSHESNALNDFGLTNYGSEQVLKAAIKTRLKQGTLIISSDYLRAKQTAQTFHDIICATSEIQYDKRIRERDFGDLELQNTNSYEQVWQQDELSANSQKYGVESVNKVLNRALLVIEQLEQTKKNKDILLVGHGDVLQILLTFYQGIDPKFHRSISPLKNAEIRSLPILQNKLSA